MYCLNDGKAHTSTVFMLIDVAGNQDDVIKRTKFENMFVNTSCSGCILIQKVNRFCASQNTFRIKPGNLKNPCPSQIHVNKYFTFQVFACCVLYLLLTCYLSHKTHVRYFVFVYIVKRISSFMTVEIKIIFSAV